MKNILSSNNVENTSKSVVKLAVKRHKVSPASLQQNTEQLSWFLQR